MFGKEGPTFLELARQGLSSTQRGYDLLAPKFDHTPFCTPEAILGVVAEQLSSRGPFKDGLDLCCGTGLGLVALRQACTRSVTGLDFSTEMLAQARARPALAPGAGTAPVALVLGDALDMEWQEKFDVVTCHGAFGHIPPDREADFVSRIRRSLRPGGVFAFVTFPMPRPLSAGWLFGRGYNAAAHLRNLLVRPPFVMLYLTFTADHARQRLEDADFRVELVPGLFPEPYQKALLGLAHRPLRMRRPHR